MVLKYRNWFSEERITNNDDFCFKNPVTKLGHFKTGAHETTLSPFSTRRICSRDAKRKQEFSNVIGWRKSSLLRQPITLPDSCFRFASREQIRLVENGL